MMLNMMPVVNMFSIRLQATDTVGSYDANRRWTETAEPPRTIHGSFQPVSEKNLQYLPEGFISAGAMVLKTNSDVSFVDLSQTDGGETRQTYIDHAGERWRVHSRAHWADYGAFNGYLCEKYYDNNQ